MRDGLAGLHESPSTDDSDATTADAQRGRQPSRDAAHSDHSGFERASGYANNAYDRDNNAYDRDNNAYDRDNNAYCRDNNAYDRDNNAYDRDNNAYDRDNNAYDRDNNAYDRDNSAYDCADDVPSDVPHAPCAPKRLRDPRALSHPQLLTGHATRAAGCPT
jgi:uncharacterized protein (DUF3084 family)